MKTRKNFYKILIIKIKLKPKDQFKLKNLQDSKEFLIHREVKNKMLRLQEAIGLH